LVLTEPARPRASLLKAAQGSEAIRR